MFSAPRGLRRPLRRAAVTTAAMLLLATGCDSGGGGGNEEEDATRWRLDYVSASRDTYLHDIAVASADQGWALATQKRKDGSLHQSLLHRQGADWRPARLPQRLLEETGMAQSELAGGQLGASAPDNVWLFADEKALRWDGTQWRANSAEFNVRDIAVLAPDDVWALDASTPDPVAHHWNGARWTDHRLPTSSVNSLSASGPDDVWAAGRHHDSRGDGDQPAAVHFDGKKWRSVPMPEYRFPEPKPNEEAWLGEILALSPDDAWAFGAHSYSAQSGSDTRHTPFALHWDGARWAEDPKALADPDKGLADRHLVATGDGAGGFVLSSLFGKEQHRSAKGALRVIKDPEPVAGRSGKGSEDDRRQHFELYDLQRVPGTRDIWAAGAVGLPPLHRDKAFSRGAVASYSAGG